MSGTDVALNRLAVDELFERASAAYVELLDKQCKPPKITQVMDVLCRDFPDDYPHEHRQHYLAKLHCEDYNAHLEKYRGEYIQRQLAPRLLAAHMGHKIGAKALERLIERLDDPESEIKDKDLVALATLGFGLAEKVQGEVKGMVGDGEPQQNTFNTLIQLMPTELAEAMTLEIIRRKRIELSVVNE